MAGRKFGIISKVVKQHKEINQLREENQRLLATIRQLQQENIELQQRVNALETSTHSLQ